MTHRPSRLRPDGSPLLEGLSDLRHVVCASTGLWQSLLPRPNLSPRIRFLLFDASLRLTPSGPACSCSRPLPAVLSSSQRFASGFLQTSGHPRRPGLPLILAGWIEDFHLHASHESFPGQGNNTLPIRYDSLTPSTASCRSCTSLMISTEISRCSALSHAICGGWLMLSGAYRNANVSPPDSPARTNTEITSEWTKSSQTTSSTRTSHLEPDGPATM